MDGKYCQKGFLIGGLGEWRGKVKIKIFDRNLETVNEDIDPSRDDDLKIIEYKLLSSCTLGSVAKPPGSQTNPGD